MNLFSLFGTRKPAPPSDLYEGGDGSSYEKAVVIKTDRAADGVRAEYEYVAHECGAPKRDWDLQQQALAEHEGKPYDVLTIKLRSGQERTFYFNIERFYGRY